jgi:hypothetical protein
MKTIAYYISDYGFGHATRSVALIRQLLRVEKSVRVIICHSFASRFLQQSLHGDPRVKFRLLETDFGYVLKKDSLEPDIEAFTSAYELYIRDWPQQIVQEQRFLRENSVDLVISDIVAFPFEAARSLGIPSVGVSNFTWYTAYRSWMDEEELLPLKRAYEQMTYFFELAGSYEPKWGRETRQFGFFAREIDDVRVELIRKRVDPDGDRCVVFFGLGMKVELGRLDQLPLWDSPDCMFIVSSNVSIDRPNVFVIPPQDTESQWYIAAADIVFSKPGWGTVSEAVCAHRPLLVLDRPTVPEDQHTISFLKKHRLCQTITWDDLQSLVIDETMIQEWNRHYGGRHFANEAEKIERELCRIIHLKG